MAYAYPPTRYYYGHYGPYWSAVSRTDPQITDDIRNRLRWDSWVDAEQVNIDVHNRVATLTGTVDSPVEKRAAGDDAWDTPGVVDVINNLAVRRPAPQR